MEPGKIKPEHNPWYLLATLYGEAESTDNELHARNRTAWNRFMAAELSEGDRVLLIKEKRCFAEELEPFSPEELSQVEKRFAERHQKATGKAGTDGAKTALPDLKRQRIDFSNVKFDHPFSVKGFFFPIQRNVERGGADFSGAIFSDQADFLCATLLGRADFSGATFFSLAAFLGATISKANFRDVTFSDQADFREATFSGLADFRKTTFSEPADFGSATFSSWAIFRGATFSNRAHADFSADFSGATFYGADFSGATFCEASFRSATFSGWGRADFSGATFRGETVFVNAKMEGPTTFENAKFSTTPPQFLGAKLHQGTVWRGVPPWPLPGKHEEAGSFIDAYACLKLEMDRLKKHEDELDFFALEQQSRRVLHGDWKAVSELRLPRRTISFPLKIPEKSIPLWPRKLLSCSFAPPTFPRRAWTIRLMRPAPGLAIALYGWLSDYGRSYVRPLCGLLITVAAGIRFFWWHFGLSGFFQAVGHSFANTFGVLGFRKDLVSPEVIACLPGWLKAVAAAQTIAGIVLLFLFGLAIRNRFRMK